jgi:hypothetical protein
MKKLLCVGILFIASANCLIAIAQEKVKLAFASVLQTNMVVQSSRKVAINWLPDLSHHRAYRSVHGGLLE